ncbi:hypothetical protein C8Q80DRAFT_1181782 [Daedaleopsis nitida]|nr:hypothetical protein C8Q80DRAFT_1181782 [Daedaleopsis nitida]
MPSPSFTHIARTPLPRGVAHVDALTLLQNHSAMIELNPLVIAHERCDGSPSSPSASAPETNKPSATYRITDSIDYLPLGLWKGKVVYYADFWNTEDGIKTKVNAAMGFVSESVWKIEEEPAKGEGEGATLVLTEVAQVTCPRVMKMFVEGTIRKSHDELGRRLITRLETGRSGQETAVAS